MSFVSDTVCRESRAIQFERQLFSTIRGSGWSGLNIRMIHCELSHGHPLPRTVLNVSDVDLRGFDRQQNDLRWDTKPHWHNAGSNSSRYE